MSNLTVEISVASARMDALLERLASGLGDPTSLNQMIANRAEGFTRDYLRQLAMVRHRTAEGLGAEPTGHLEKAAENVTSRADADAAYVGVTSPGITRAFRDITITGRPWLTIPAHPLAYGRRAASLERLLGVRLFRPLRKGAKAKSSRLAQGPGSAKDKGAGHHTKQFDPADRARALAARIQGKLVTFYSLATQVHQKQDRTLLPSDEAYRTLSARAALEYIQTLIAVRDNTLGGATA